MDFDRRLPRRMLSSWVPHSRPTGAPTMTYGRSLGKALDHYHLDHSRLARACGKPRGMAGDAAACGLQAATTLPSASPPSSAGAHEAVACMRHQDDGQT